jgi:hypothetical protein
MFDPRIGRWLEEDPIGFQAGDDNLYRYAGNNPTNKTDSSGLEPLDDRWWFARWKEKHWESDGQRRVATLSAAEMKQAGTGQWYEFRLEVYQSDYFTADVDNIMRLVAHYYARYRILINWKLTKIHTPIPPSLAKVGLELWPGKRFRVVNYDDDNPTDWAKWYLDHFGSDHPSLFVVGSLNNRKSWGWQHGLDTDDYGATYNGTVGFVPWSLGGPPYDTAAAHEIGWMLLGKVQYVRLFGKNLMKQSLAGGTGELQLDKLELNDEQLKTIRGNPKGWLRPIKANEVPVEP